MELFEFVKPERNVSPVDAEERKKNRERREFLKDLQAEGETLWVYPFADSEDNGTISRVYLKRTGHLAATVSTEIGVMELIIDKLQVHYFSDGGDYNPGADPEDESVLKSPIEAFNKAWELYIKDFN